VSDTETPRFLAACRRQPVDRPPLWLMRQAGRYLPEYHVTRGQAGDFLTLCKTPDLAVEVTLQPIRRFAFDASIVFSDILVPAEAMGAEVSFKKGEGPHIANPIRSAADVEALREPDPEEACPYVFEIIRLLRHELGGTSLIGFVAAPFTLAAYMVEGGGSRNYEQLKTLLFGAPEVGRRLMERIVAYSAKHAIAEVRAGAQALQLFDTWAELLSVPDYERWCLPWANQVFQRVRSAVGPEVPLIYFSKGTAAHLHLLPQIEADVISVDWRIDLARARAALPGRAVQGNLDPLALLAGPDATRERARQVLEAGAQAGPGHIFNLGHGILPTTPTESVEALCELVRDWKPASP
jgi:uroporphyrinogen decarboxylase